MSEITPEEQAFLDRMRVLTAEQRAALQQSLDDIASRKPISKYAMIAGFAAAGGVPMALALGAMGMGAMLAKDSLKNIWDNPEDSEYDKL